MTHAAGNNELGAVFSDPFGKYTRFVRRGGEHFRADDGFAFRVNGNKGELFAMTEVHTKLAVGGWNGDFHGIFSFLFWFELYFGHKILNDLVHLLVDMGGDRAIGDGQSRIGAVGDGRVNQKPAQQVKTRLFGQFGTAGRVPENIDFLLTVGGTEVPPCFQQYPKPAA